LVVATDPVLQILVAVPVDNAFAAVLQFDSSRNNKGNNSNTVYL